MSSRVDLTVMAEMASRSRRKRILFNVLHVWNSYTKAMKSSPPDPSSPFLYERSPKEDRRLIQRVSASLQNKPPPPPSSAGTSVWGGDPEPMTAEDEMALLTASRAKAFQDLTQNLPVSREGSVASRLSFAHPGSFSRLASPPGHSIDTFLAQQQQLSSGVEAGLATDPRRQQQQYHAGSSQVPLPVPSFAHSSRRGGGILKRIDPPPAAPLGFQGFPADSVPRGHNAPSPVPYRLTSMASPSPMMTAGPTRDEIEAAWSDPPHMAVAVAAGGGERGGSITSQSSDEGGRPAAGLGLVRPQLRGVRSSILDNARNRATSVGRGQRIPAAVMHQHD